MRFLVDNQLPAALARFLESVGHDAKHVLDLGLEDSSDKKIWNLATAEKRVVITKDEDFLRFSNQAGSSGSLIWVRMGNCRKKTLLEAFQRSLPMLVSALEGGNRVLELR